MNNYPIHTVDTAPEGARQSLAGLQQAFGLVPNLAARSQSRQLAAPAPCAAQPE